jgi:hypothetical protein
VLGRAAAHVAAILVVHQALVVYEVKVADLELFVPIRAAFAGLGAWGVCGMCVYAYVWV